MSHETLTILKEKLSKLKCVDAVKTKNSYRAIEHVFLNKDLNIYVSIRWERRDINCVSLIFSPTKDFKRPKRPEILLNFIARIYRYVNKNSGNTTVMYMCNKKVLHIYRPYPKLQIYNAICDESENA